jgi:hypothetical protein
VVCETSEQTLSLRFCGRARQTDSAPLLILSPVPSLDISHGTGLVPVPPAFLAVSSELWAYELGAVLSAIGPRHSPAAPRVTLLALSLQPLVNHCPTFLYAINVIRRTAAGGRIADP